MYIRTKEGVYKVSHYNDWATHKRKGATLIDGDKTSYIKNENIIAQSENLEELCDCFVLMERDAKPIIFKTLQGAINNKIYDDEIIYGCIWTFKGLIYVAKMDNEGKLVLI